MTAVNNIEEELISKIKEDPKLLFDNRQFERLLESEKKLSDVMVNSPTGKLSELVFKCLDVINASNPDQINKKPSFFDRFRGADLEKKVGFVHAANKLEEHIVDAAKICLKLSVINGELVKLENDTILDNERLSKTLNACDAIKKEGYKFADSFEQDRFDKRRANLRMLLQSNVMSVEGFKLQRINVMTIIDKFDDMKTVTLPIWKQHAIHYDLNRNLTPDIGIKIKKAHQHVSTELTEISKLLN